jgi:trehalose-phosphatase
VTSRPLAAGSAAARGEPPAPDADELRRALERFAGRDRVLVAVDFDGTLAPIVLDPDAARALPRAAEAVEVLAGLPGTHVAIVSGRPLDQLRRLLRPPGDVALVGSHGAEVDDGAPVGTGNGTNELDDHERALLARLRDAVAAIVARHPGTALEVKPASVVLHTRGADREAAIAATGDALEGPARWDGVHVLRGKEVVELAATDATKGRALRRLRTRLGLASGGVLYVGDDATDEQAFAVLDDDAGDVTVKVGHGRTLARHRVRDPQDVADLLLLLAGLRSSGGS